jgi:hypothetical protein
MATKEDLTTRKKDGPTGDLEKDAVRDQPKSDRGGAS